MRTRLELHDILSNIPGVVKCYFSPPEGVSMVYPCIVYRLTNSNVVFADNLPYMRMKRYSVTVIDEDPDSEIPDNVSQLPYCISERNYVYEGLYHYGYVLYF